MEPLSPNDPIRTLLGKARPVEPRPNFTQNVLRAIRQMPQSLGVWERVQAWLGGFSMPRMALAGAAAVAVAVLAVTALQKEPSGDAPVVVQKSGQPAAVAQVAVQPAVHEISAAMILAATAEPAPTAEADDMDPMGLLLVQQDTSALSDSELALLVY